MTRQEMYHDVCQFYVEEARLLDHRRFHEWLDLFTDDAVYRMPVRITDERGDATGIVEDMTFFEETKESLTIRVKRLGTTSAWAELPPPRTRHFVSNIHVKPQSTDDKVCVCSYFLFLRSRADDANVEQLFGERRDVLRGDASGFKICSRTIIPDQAVLTVKNLSMFL